MAAERVKKYDCTSVIICYLLGKKVSRKVETVVRGQGSNKMSKLSLSGSGCVSAYEAGGCM
jgi:hypothetical protein